LTLVDATGPVYKYNDISFLYAPGYGFRDADPDAPWIQ